MQRARHDSLPVNVSELETMHRLVTAENFDENAVRAQAEKMAQEQVARQVEMAKVRNQMYHSRLQSIASGFKRWRTSSVWSSCDVTQWQKFTDDAFE